MNGQNRADIKLDARLSIVLKTNQRTGKRTEGGVVRFSPTAAAHQPPQHHLDAVGVGGLGTKVGCDGTIRTACRLCLGLYRLMYLTGLVEKHIRLQTIPFKAF